jgi:aspartyl-tRNA(Asn)/glutamyl-tRNA(Gln) amidotransferase subunit A
MGTFALSSGHYGAFYQKAQKVRMLIKQDFLAAFKEVDAILGPITPSTAYKIGEKCNDPISMYLGDIFSIPANLAGLPAMSMPGGMIDGLPVGIQLIGRSFEEATLLRIAHHYQQVTDWHTQIPADFLT